MRITDCSQLAREWPRETILRDDVCAAQCGLVLQSTNSANSDLRPPPTGRQQRLPRSRKPQQNPRVSSSFQGFRFPDLTQFISG